MSAESACPPAEAEVVANLWVYADEAGYVGRLAGKTYVLEGSDREKLDVLRQLAATDFLSAEWMPVPKSFNVVGPNGERLHYATLSVLSDDVSRSLLIEPLLDKLAAALPDQLRDVNGVYQSFKMPMPEAPLTILTVVIERPDGRLVPLIKT